MSLHWNNFLHQCSFWPVCLHCHKWCRQNFQRCFQQPRGAGAAWYPKSLDSRHPSRVKHLGGNSGFSCCSVCHPVAESIAPGDTAVSVMLPWLRRDAEGVGFARPRPCSRLWPWWFVSSRSGISVKDVMMSHQVSWAVFPVLFSYSSLLSFQTFSLPALCLVSCQFDSLNHRDWVDLCLLFLSVPRVYVLCLASSLIIIGEKYTQGTFSTYC